MEPLNKVHSGKFRWATVMTLQRPFLSQHTPCVSDYQNAPNARSNFTGNSHGCSGHKKEAYYLNMEFMVSPWCGSQFSILSCHELHDFYIHTEKIKHQIKIYNFCSWFYSFIYSADIVVCLQCATPCSGHWGNKNEQQDKWKSCQHNPIFDNDKHYFFSA